MLKKQQVRPLWGLIDPKHMQHYYVNNILYISLSANDFLANKLHIYLIMHRQHEI